MLRIRRIALWRPLYTSSRISYAQITSPYHACGVSCAGLLEEKNGFPAQVQGPCYFEREQIEPAVTLAEGWVGSVRQTASFLLSARESLHLLPTLLCWLLSNVSVH